MIWLENYHPLTVDGCVELVAVEEAGEEVTEEEGDDCQDEDDGQPVFPPHGLVHPGTDPAPAPGGKVREDRRRSRRLF